MTVKPAKAASLAKNLAKRRRTYPGGAAGRSQEPEVLCAAVLPGKPADRNSPEFPPPGRTLGCWATDAAAAAGLCGAGSEPSVAPTSCAGNLPSRPPPLLSPLLASRNPCPWHYLHLSGAHNTLAPTCFKAKLHRKRGRQSPDMASALTDRTSRAPSTYTYTSRPRALPCQRSRYRDSLTQPDEEPMRYGNIMYDRRVIRGNTYALQTGPLLGQPDSVELQRQREARKRALARKQAQEQLRPQTPEPVEGRKHVDVQTVKPVLEVLVGKTIEQSLLEVMEEEELANLRASQREYEELRNSERAEVQRLEEQERRHREEKERRKKQQWEIVHKHNETSQKIAARAFAQRYLADLLPSVFGSLRDSGYFYDPIERDIEVGFLPWLMNEVEKTMDCSMVGRTVLDMLIREVVEKRLYMYEHGEDTHQSPEPEDEPGGPGAMTESLEASEFPEQSMSQTQELLLDREYLQRTTYDKRSSQERKFMEERELLGQDEETAMRKSLGEEELS
ncbi:radial spoke head protein 3 homolog isoform X2 [Pongo pygmaeus]|uniref:radial spoke head protein 3 homolog isoform X2 n=1 Tax=Pongo pygmaeus TaxID=9600 RepID=UPI00300C9657